MRTIEYLILGAGPSGLALAHTLIDSGVPSSKIVVLEKETTAGGLCRSETVDGAPLDIGGGHFLDIKHRAVLDLLFRFLPESEWNRFDRISKISLHGKMVDHPLEANLWQFDIPTQVEYLESIAAAGCIQGNSMPESFEDWIRWKLGDRIAEDYMLPYNRKIWSMDLSDIGTYWLYKLPDVSFRDTLRSCLEGKPLGSLPAHGVFLYPKQYGYGEVWKRMGKALGASLVTGEPLATLDLTTRQVNDRWRARRIFNSIPWHHWLTAADIPQQIAADINSLRNVSIDVDYVNQPLDSDAHWIYDPQEDSPHHRRLLRANFCLGSKGYWSETNSKRSPATSTWRHRNPYAYPVNTRGKPEAVARILAWASNLGITGFGRWGTWEHMNSDIAVKSAIELGRKVAKSE